MATQTKSLSQGLLFSEPAFSETGVWCELSDGIDPAQWASLCRHIGSLSPRNFEAVRRKIRPNPDSFRASIKRLFDLGRTNSIKVPVFSIGPSGIGGEYQREH